MERRVIPGWEARRLPWALGRVPASAGGAPAALLLPSWGLARSRAGRGEGNICSRRCCSSSFSASCSACSDASGCRSRCQGGTPPAEAPPAAPSPCGASPPSDEKLARLWMMGGGRSAWLEPGGRWGSALRLAPLPAVRGGGAAAAGGGRAAAASSTCAATASPRAASSLALHQPPRQTTTTIIAIIFYFRCTHQHQLQGAP